MTTQSKPNHSENLPRLNRISGQIDGIKKMIEEERYCLDIVNQIKAVRSALKSVEKNNNNKEYVFFDGPPFANGLPHYGHLLTGFIKDIYARYHTTIRCSYEISN